MEILNPYTEEFLEIKLCRLCGSDSKENIDIFTSKPISSRNEDLLTKILTVYPLVLYKDDPLPQHICPKCIGNVSTTYQDIQQVMRQQNKWMNITKAVQPEHKYFHILDVIESSTTATKETIKASYDIEIKNIPLGKFLSTALKENQDTTAVKPTNKDNISETVVKNIQNKLESNGFTIKRIKVATSTNNQDFNINIDSEDLTEKSLEPVANIVTCNYCKQKFSDLKILAQHQLIHLKLSANKIFQKILLPKQLRRGRLISLNDNKCIRCLNCWRIYKDNKAILQHWSEGECEFYCCVCGKEFPHSPKMLREHVAESHGINYRSVRNEIHLQQKKPVVETPLLSVSDVLKKSKKQSPRTSTKNPDGTITCKICHKVFDNFRSSNSHMRKHKPPVRFREPVMPPADISNKYSTDDNYETKPSTSNIYYDNSAASNPQYARPPRPAYRVIMKNGPLRGIKTKIVQKRHDFLNNFATDDRHLTPMNSTSETNDDENLIVPELLTTAVKTEHMLDENPHNDNNYGDYTSNSLSQAIKPEPLDNAEFMVQETQLCFICNESFSNARDYQLHTMFVHNIN